MRCDQHRGLTDQAEQLLQKLNDLHSFEVKVSQTEEYPDGHIDHQSWISTRTKIEIRDIGKYSGMYSNEYGLRGFFLGSVLR